MLKYPGQGLAHSGVLSGGVHCCLVGMQPWWKLKMVLRGSDAQLEEIGEVQELASSDRYRVDDKLVCLGAKPQRDRSSGKTL